MNQPHIYHCLNVLSERVGSYLFSILSRFDITPQQAYAIIFIHDGGAISFKSLRHEMKLTSASISGLVGRLQKSGHITIERDPADSRVKIIKLTDSGSDIYNRVHNLLSDFDQHLKNAVSADVLTSFYEFAHLAESEINKLNKMQS